MLGRGSNHFRLVVNEILQNSCTKQLSVAVQVEASGKSTSSSTKEMKSTKDVFGAEQF
jgi:hypothetical protein